MQIQPPVINIFEKAVRKAGKSIVRDFGEIENVKIQSKDVGDFVTTADIKAEKILLEILQQSYPNATYITEESEKIKGDQEIIVIDPIDGTTNFIHGIPFVGIVIGRVFEGEITDGIIFNPILNELYSATKGGGAWCNNKRFHVSNRDKMSNCIMGTGVPHANRGYKNYLNDIIKKFESIF
jgi:myo-inositol-1(or 4)-monophosphatase